MNGGKKKGRTGETNRMINVTEAKKQIDKGGKKVFHLFYYSFLFMHSLSSADLPACYMFKVIIT